MTAATMGERVRLEVADSVAILTLQRPEKRNAIDLGMLAALDAACDRIDEPASEIPPDVIFESLFELNHKS